MRGVWGESRRGRVGTISFLSFPFFLPLFHLFGFSVFSFSFYFASHSIFPPPLFSSFSSFPSQMCAFSPPPSSSFSLPVLLQPVFNVHTPYCHPPLSRYFLLRYPLCLSVRVSLFISGSFFIRTFFHIVSLGPICFIYMY